MGQLNSVVDFITSHMLQATDLRIVISFNVGTTFKRERYSIEFTSTGSKDLFLKCILCNTEDRKLRVFENRVMREIFGSKRDEVTG
jgi:hypothetical protein